MRHSRTGTIRAISSMTGAAASLIAALAMSTVALAQQSPWRSFVSVSPVQEEAKLDLGGDVTVTGVILRAGTSRDLGGGNRAGITVAYDYFDHSFDNPVAFAGVSPWHILQRYGFSTPVSFALQDGWSKKPYFGRVTKSDPLPKLCT